MFSDKNKGTKETSKSEPSDEIRDLLNKIEQLRRETETEKTTGQKLQETVNILNQKLIQERTDKNNWLIKEKQLNQEATLLKQKTTTVQAELEDTRKQKKTLDSEIKKYMLNERQFIKERSTSETKEKQLNELVQQLTCQKVELSQMIKRLQHESASKQTICDALQAEKQDLLETQMVLQSELQSSKKEQQVTKQKMISAEEQLRNVTLQLEQTERRKLSVAGIITLYDVI